MANNQKHCSFCGRPKSETKLMIAGIGANICDECIEQAVNILHEELSVPGTESEENKEISELKKPT